VSTLMLFATPPIARSGQICGAPCLSDLRGVLAHAAKERVHHEPEFAWIFVCPRHQHGAIHRSLKKLSGDIRRVFQPYRTLLDAKRQDALKPLAQIIEVSLNRGS